MFRLKHKLLFLTLITSLLLAALFVVSPKNASADHDSCSGGEAALERCVQTKREAANVRCFENNAGKNDIIGKCVEGVTAHFTHSGSPANAPPLPTTAAPEATNSKNITDNADCKVDPDAAPPDNELNSNNCRIVYWINIAINALSVLVGIVVTIMIIIGGIQYTAAREDPNAVAKAKKQIFNAIFALVLYGLLFAFLDYAVPGGLL